VVRVARTPAGALAPRGSKRLPAPPLDRIIVS